MRASDYLIQSLICSGIKYVFGISGSTNLDILDSIYDNKQLHFIAVRHEQAAASMADGYARVTAQPAVCIAHAGAGATHLLTGVACAYRDSVPILVLTGNEDQRRLGREVCHEIDHIGIFKPITKLSVQLKKASDLPRILNKARRVCLSGRPGPVHLDLPMNLMRENIESVPHNRFESVAPTAFRIPKELVEDICGFIRNSARPLFLAGEGATWDDSGKELLNLLEKFCIPVVTNDLARGCIPEDHPLCLGFTGRLGNQSANLAMEEADLIIALGSRLDDLTTLNWTLPKKRTKIVQVYSDVKEIGKQIPVTVGVLGNVKGFIKALMDNLKIERKSFWENSRIKQGRIADRKRFVAHSFDSIPSIAAI